MSTRPLVRGYMITSNIEFLEKNYDRPTREKLYATLSPDVRSSISKYNKVEWYPLNHCYEFFAAFALNEPNESSAYDALYRCGHYIGENATQGYLKLLLRIMTAGLFARKVGDFWKRDHRVGELKGDHSFIREKRVPCVLSGIEEYPYVAPTACGFMCNALEAMGYAQVKCVLSGWSLANPAPSEARYELTWK
jgi:hypothetical protein